MTTEKFEPGDKVYHLSDPSTIWVVEEIKDKEAICSTLIKETKELKKEKFNLVSLAKKHSSGGGGIVFKSSQNKYRY